MLAVAAKPPRHLRRFDSPQQEAFLNLWRTYDRLRMLEDELFSRHDLTAQQYNALRLLKAAHPRRLPTLHLASRLVSRAPDITRLLDRLARRGLIERHRPQDDRRAVHVGITRPGLAVLAELSSHVQDCHQRQLGHLKASELKTLVQMLQKCRHPHESPDSDWH